MAELGFYDWTQAVIKAIRKNRIVAGRNITLEEHEDKTIIHSNYIFGSGGESGGGYNGPFAVIKESDTSIRVYGNNLSEGRTFYNHLILGLKTLQIPETIVTGITSSGHIVLNITRNGKVYYAPIQFIAGTIPEQTNTNFYHILAFVRCESSVIKEIIQYQYGIIQHSGRFL